MCLSCLFLVILDVGGRLSRVFQRTQLDYTSPLPDSVTYPFTCLVSVIDLGFFSLICAYDMKLEKASLMMAEPGWI
ncbi:hypothetical protein STEG23_019096, partial [Scotinomys teguina]